MTGLRSLNSFWRLSLPLVVSAAMLVLVPVTGWAATTAPTTTASATVTSSLAPARAAAAAAEQSRVGQAVAKNSLQPGDLVFFHNTYKNGVDHVGIYIGDNKFIDAWPGAGVTISDLTRPYFVSHYWGAKRVLP